MEADRGDEYLDVGDEPEYMDMEADRGDEYLDVDDEPEYMDMEADRGDEYLAVDDQPEKISGSGADTVSMVPKSSMGYTPVDDEQHAEYTSILEPGEEDDELYAVPEDDDPEDEFWAVNTSHQTPRVHANPLYEVGECHSSSVAPSPFLGVLFGCTLPGLPVVVKRP
jgi:hypothetical protein